MYLLFFGINSLYISFIGRSANDSKKWKTSASQFYNDMKQIDTGMTLTNNDITTSSDSNMYFLCCIKVFKVPKLRHTYFSSSF